MIKYIDQKDEHYFKMIIDDTDKRILTLLSENSRQSTTELARKLDLSRTTVKDRIDRMERKGIIKGYTLRLSEGYSDGLIQAQVMISSDPKQTPKIVRTLREVSDVRALHAVNGVYDLVAMISADSTRSLDRTLDLIGGLEGIEKTVSSIILSTKFERSAV